MDELSHDRAIPNPEDLRASKPEQQRGDPIMPETIRLVHSSVMSDDRMLTNLKLRAWLKG